jgi:hypothetical protein
MNNITGPSEHGHRLVGTLASYLADSGFKSWLGKRQS